MDFNHQVKEIANLGVAEDGMNELSLSLVVPLTEASGEYQAIAYTLQHPETQLVFVDRAVDFVFQWTEQEIHPLLLQYPELMQAITELLGLAQISR
jgi:hypothetical protein